MDDQSATTIKRVHKIQQMITEHPEFLEILTYAIKIQGWTVETDYLELFAEDVFELANKPLPDLAPFQGDEF